MPDRDVTAAIKDRIRTVAVAIAVLVENDLDGGDWPPEVRAHVEADIEEALTGGIAAFLREIAVICVDLDRGLNR